MSGLVAGCGVIGALCALGAPTRAGARAAGPIHTYDAAARLPASLSDLPSRRAAWDELQFAATLQGLVNRGAPRLYLFLVGERARIDRYWLEKLQAPGEWLADRPLRPIATPEELARAFRRYYRGAVVWDERVPATANLASTIAGVERAVALRYDAAPGSLYHRLVEAPDGPRLSVVARLFGPNGSPMFTGSGTIPGTRIASTGSAKCDAYLWAAEKYLKTGRCDATCLGYYPDAWWVTRDARVPAVRTLLSNHDYFVARRGFFFDLSPWDDEAPDDDRGQAPGTDGSTLRRVLRYAYDAARGKMIHVGGFTPWDQKYTDFTGGRHGGVETEWRYAEVLSCYNAYMDADAPGLHAMANASLYRLYPLAARYPQRNLPGESSLRAKGYLLADGSVAARAFVSIYVGDYDSAAWLYERMPDLWDDPARGTVPLGWAFNPNLADRFAPGMAYARKTATPNDSFVAGDSGAGYLNPGNLVPPRKWSDLPSGLDAWEAHCSRYYRRWDLRMTGFVIDGFAPGMSEEVKRAYARFSPGGVVAQKVPPTSLVGDVPFLRMGPDLTGGAEQGAATIAGHAPRQGPGFAIYRTILWSPSAHRDMFERLREARPDIEVVDPHTLMLLLKRHLEHGRSAR